MSRGKTEDKPRRNEEEIYSADPGPPLIIPRHRVVARVPMGRSRRRFFFPAGRESPAAVCGRLRGYQNHLTTSSRLGASPRFLLTPLILYSAIIALLWIAPIIGPWRSSRSLTLTVTRCVVFVRRYSVNIVKIYFLLLIDNSIACPSDSG